MFIASRVNSCGKVLIICSIKNSFLTLKCSLNVCIKMSIKCENNANMKREAEQEKEQGNKHFKGGHFDAAIDCYTKAIQLYPENAVFYCNRALAYQKKGLLTEAESDCNTALNIDHNYAKGYYRRAIARKLLNRYHLALQDFRTVLTIEPNNAEAILEAKQLETRLKANPLIEVQSSRNETPAETSKTISTPIIDIVSLKIDDNEVKVPQTVPKNLYQFECDWRELIGSHSNELRLEYLEMIGALTFRQLLTSTLEPQIVSDIIVAISLCHDFNFTYDMLDNLTQVQRFKTLVMFLTESEQKILKTIFSRLSQSDVLSDDRKLSVSKLANEYMISY